MTLVWIIGLAGSGKTTIGRTLWEMWQRREPNTVMLNCDERRGGNTPPEAFSIPGRRRTEEQLLRTSFEQLQAGYNVIACSVSIFEELRVYARHNVPQYFEVFANAPMSTIERRDSKRLYAAARLGKLRNVVGVDIPWEPPRTHDFVADTGPQGLDPTAAATLILRRVMAKRAA